MPTTTALRPVPGRIEGIARCFVSRWHQGYARGKLKHDPVFDDAVGWARRAARVGGPLLDAGSGLGLLAHWLRSAGVDLPIHGIDPDVRKISAARVAAQRGGLSDLTFNVDDALTVVGGWNGHVFLVDILHYLPIGDRERLLRGIAARLPPRGIVYIRNGLRGPGWRHRVTLVEEWIVRVTGWIPTSGLRLPTAQEISEHFPSDRFELERTSLWGRTPFNSYRFAFQRRG